MKPIPQEENPETVLVAVLFEKDKRTTLITNSNIYIYIRLGNQGSPFVLFSSDRSHPSSNTKPIPQEENPETVLVAVLFEKDWG